MKRWTTLLMVIGMLGMAIPTMGAMSTSKMRKNARFLTDRMAYELKLSQQQYDDVYEVNYDFINNVRYLMDDVVQGNNYAVGRYYDFLDIRNDDLRWVLSNAQYRRFINTKHFYRPIYTAGSKWDFLVFTVYSNLNHFYFDKPHHYSTYRGGHGRTDFGSVSYYRTHYRNRYHHDVYKGDFRLHPNKPQHKPNKPNSPQVKPNKPGKPNTSQVKPGNRPQSKPQVRPNGNKKNERPNQSKARPARTDKKQDNKQATERQNHSRTAVRSK